MRIEGIKGLDRKLNKLMGPVIEQHMEKAVGNQIKMVQAEAKLGCPVNDGELRNSIRTKVEKRDDYIMGTCYTNKEYGPFVEFGTGPKGEKDHAGVSPHVLPSYSQNPWWIHESQIDKDTAEKYHWFKIETPKGIFYQCMGQPAQPFMYPALKNNEKRATKNIGSYLSKKIKEAAHD